MQSFSVKEYSTWGGILLSIEKIFADDTREALFAWDGYAKAAPAREK